MAHFNQNKHINALIVSVLRSQQVQMELQNSIKITYCILGNIFQILDAQNVSVKPIIPCLVIISKKSENDIANIVKKRPIILFKKILLRNYNQISQRKGKTKSLLGMWVFSSKIYVSQHIF